MEYIKVTNPWGVQNQYVIRTDIGVYFQSYDSIIAFIPNEGKTILGGDWDYSKTTGKYRNLFLNEDKKTTQLKINKGIYIIDDNLIVRDKRPLPVRIKAVIEDEEDYDLDTLFKELNTLIQELE